MKYREFVSWCNERTCDGLWGMSHAMYCIEIIECMKKIPFWKKRKAWKEIENEVLEKIVNPINEDIKRLEEEYYKNKGENNENS